MEYDMGYNLTEEIRHLLDADYPDSRTGQKDIQSFEIAKKHILLIIGKPDIDIKEYTDLKEKLCDEFHKVLIERMKLPFNEQTIQLISMDLEQYANTYNAITLKYMNDTISFLMNYVGK